jgi:hypothetical protein
MLVALGNVLFVTIFVLIARKGYKMEQKKEA